MLIHLRDLYNSIEKERDKPKFSSVSDDFSKKHTVNPNRESQTR